MRVSCACLARHLRGHLRVSLLLILVRLIDRWSNQNFYPLSTKMSCSIVVLQGFGCASSPPMVIKAPGQVAQVAFQRCQRARTKSAWPGCASSPPATCAGLAPLARERLARVLRGCLARERLARVLRGCLARMSCAVLRHLRVQILAIQISICNIV